jgi:hypothetical protein
MPKGGQMNDASWLFYPGVALASLIGAYFGAYFKRKGENLATHEDLDKLIEQMSAVTETTENIKAAISDDVWDRQKQWEMRRDVVFEAVRALGELQKAASELRSFHPSLTSEVKDPRDPARSIWLEKQVTFSTCDARAASAMSLAAMVVGEKLSNVLGECVQEIHSIALKTLEGDTAYAATSGAKKVLAEKVKAVNSAARWELKLDVATLGDNANRRSLAAVDRSPTTDN